MYYENFINPASVIGKRRHIGQCSLLYFNIFPQVKYKLINVYEKQKFYQQRDDIKYTATIKTRKL